MAKLTKSLVLIVWNECAGCRIDVPRLPVDSFEEVFAIDGGSTDGTAEYLASQGIPVHRQRAKSLNAAYADAVDRSTCDAVVIFFPKATLDPAITLEIARRLDEGHAMVVASRNLPGAHNEEDGKFFRPRKWGVGALSLFAALVWKRRGARVRDVLHGVKGFTVDAYRRMQIAPTGVTIDLEMVVRAYRLGLSVVEFPVNEAPYEHGQTRFPLFRTGRRLGEFLLRELARRRV